MRWFASGVLLLAWLAPAALQGQGAPAAVGGAPGAAAAPGGAPAAPGGAPPAAGGAAGAPTAPAPPAAGDVVEELLPEKGPIAAPQLTPVEQARVVPRLVAAQRGATGKRAQRIAFLLAMLGSEPEQNRDVLVAALRGCGARPAARPDAQPGARPGPRQACDEDTARFVILLYREGHDELLDPLIAAGKRSGGALAEVLGAFYHEVVSQTPEEFLAAIRILDPQVQDRLCALAGKGSGNAPAGQADELHRRMAAILGDLPRRCLRRIESPEAGAEEAPPAAPPG
jgi:hypothetical protein